MPVLQGFTVLLPLSCSATVGADVSDVRGSPPAWVHLCFGPVHLM